VLRALPFIIGLVLAVYSVVDVLQTDSAQLKPLGRLGWLAAVLLVPFVGPLIWIGTSRTRAVPAAGGGKPQKPQRVLAPEDDPEFLQQLRDVDSTHERMLKQWEDDLRRREQGLGKDDTDPPEPGGKPTQ